MRRSTAVGVVPRSCSVGMGRIDEERPYEFRDNNYNGVNVRKELLVYPRSRSYVVRKVLEKFGLPDILKSKHKENEAYISELETIGQA
ncbi:hypothetical protein CsSME_00024094 [Camellia sinensis var. sinensis]